MQSTKWDTVNLYKIMGHFTHKLHYQFNVKDANYNYRDVPVSFQMQFLTIMGYLTLKDEGIKKDDTSLLDPFTDTSNYLKLLIYSAHFLYLEEIPLTMPSLSLYHDLLV